MEDSAQRPPMDAFTRRYLAALVVIAAVCLLWWLASWDSRVSRLNSMLESDPVLAGYPYQFEVFSLQNGVAEISSPRSAKVSAVQFLRLVQPELRDTSAIAPGMMAAQEKLATIQSRAGELVQNQEGVESIRWTIDRQWYAAHGVYLD